LFGIRIGQFGESETWHVEGMKSFDLSKYDAEVWNKSNKKMTGLAGYMRTYIKFIR